MKNKIHYFSLLFLTLSFTSHSQSDDRRENLEFGFKAGLNASNVWDENGEDFTADTKVGLAGGVFFGIPIGAFIGFQPEILISQKGFQGSGTLIGFPYSFKRTTTFIDVPLQFQLKPTEFITFLAGPQLSFLMKQKDVYTFGSNSSEQEQEFNNDNVRKNILGFVVGLDVIVYSVVVSARGAWDFQTNNGDGTNSTPRYKNQWIQLTVGFKI